MRLISCIGLLAITLVPLGCIPVHHKLLKKEGPLLPVLCLYSEDLWSQGLNCIGAKELAHFREQGFELHAGCYQTTDAKTLARYPVVVGMMPMLHAGTRAIGGQFALDLEHYIRGGGSFVLIPAPSYYGGEDFIRQLNPWLSQFGAELINEQPRDPLNQRLVTRVIGYRYLSTTNLVPHAITAGLSHLWLPLDYTDSYVLTHTMKVSPEWQVLVRGNQTCATYLMHDLSEGRQTPGAYGSAPPFLAVRQWGSGRLALFTTSSQYFVFDAYHWAFGDGFVMKEGGERLMANLLNWLAGDGAARTAVKLPVEMPPANAQGNVPICSDKAEWFRVVEQRFCPPRSSPVAYVDCGSLSDIPYSRERGIGFTDTQSWTLRWTWSELFHPTAANARAFQSAPVTYRFDGLKPNHTYQAGLLRWSYEATADRPFQVKAGALILDPAVAIPRFADKQGPAFDLLTVPAEAITPQGTLELSFAMAGGNNRGGFSTLGEIWLFDSAGGGARQAFQRLLAAQDSLQAGVNEPPFRYRPFRGLIGAQSTYSGGPSSVAELGRAARKAGYDFLAFTEDATRLDAVSLSAFRQACREASDETFRCLPGIRFSAKSASRIPLPNDPATWGGVEGYVIQDVAVLPQREDYNNPYDLFWSFLGGSRSGGRSASPSLRTPNANAISPFYQRFWRGFDVYTLSESGAVSGDARGLFTDLLSAGYGPYPRISGTFQSPDAISRVAGNDWAVTFFAESLARVESYHYTSCIGNGPRFRDYHYTFDYSAYDPSGTGLLFRENAWIVLNADVEAPSRIDSVTLFSGRVPLRVWYPNRNRVKIQEPIRVARNHELWMSVKCADGSGAMTGRYLAEDRLFMLAMCSDNQNTICSLGNPPRTFEREERDFYFSHSYWHTGEAAGQLGAMLRLSDIVPRVIETGIVQPVKRFNPCPVLFLADGSVEDHGSSELRILGASSEYNQIEYRFDTPASRTRSRVLITSFRPAPNGDTVMLLETLLEAKTNVEFRSGSPGLRHLSLAPLRDLAPAWNYTYRSADGGLVSQPFTYAEPGWARTAKLAAQGGVMLWPSDVGSLLVLPIDGTAYDLDLRVLPSGIGREQVQFLTQPARLATGQKVASRLLVVLHQGAITSGKALDDLRAAYADLSGCVKTLAQGRLRDAAYALTIDATGGGVRARFDTSRRTEPLPVILRGVNPRWPCGLADGRSFRLLEAADSTLRFTVPPSRKTIDGFAGNVVLSDQDELHMEWAGVIDGQVSLHLHNPTPRLMKARIWRHPSFGSAPHLDATVEIPAGVSLWVRGSGNTIRVTN